MKDAKTGTAKKWLAELRPYTARLAAAVALLGLAAAGFEARAWLHARSESQAISDLAGGKDIGPERRYGASSEVRLAYGLLLVRREQYGNAQAILSELTNLGDAHFQALVHYDLGNLYLRQALAETTRGEADRASPLAELAKESYRRALRADPRLWDAKYNLEVASRLMPDFDPVNSGSDELEDEQARKLWTQVPGFPRGLP